MTDSTDTRLDLYPHRRGQGVGTDLAMPTARLLTTGDQPSDVLAAHTARQVTSHASDKRLDLTKALVALRGISASARVAGPPQAQRFGSSSLDSMSGPRIAFQTAPADTPALRYAGIKSRSGTSSITLRNTDGTLAFSNKDKPQYA
jgi:hypothetical protein